MKFIQMVGDAGLQAAYPPSSEGGPVEVPSAFHRRSRFGCYPPSSEGGPVEVSNRMKDGLATKSYPPSSEGGPVEARYE